ncbi:precorrin-6A reductase [Hippea maritima]|uniref:Precorrin-6x reductase CbiJ/CobK n=1 Tax=Hippea maritima (strain ATCC 700847 / DSM 10411 / MH2) TaxID=760142 RepID=F2LU98_HIPMA|nr:precorrin-6A reductase [Hippea maritima]AEA34561.1 Precorrin-6x reductase CbiJ/CobK [Hippea maritima DSM 10411]
MILVLGGTSDTHRVVDSLKDDFIITVATDYGFNVFYRLYGERVKQVKFSEKTLTDFIKRYRINRIVDTTHPYAKEISRIAKNVSAKIGIPYEDKKRDVSVELDYKRIFLAKNTEEAKRFFKKNCKSILFTIGSKLLDEFIEFKNNGYFRVLPFSDSIDRCFRLGIEPSRIIAMQGPFSSKLNKALLDEFDIDCLVSKNSGRAGGLDAKIEAAKRKGCYLVILLDI